MKDLRKSLNNLKKIDDLLEKTKNDREKLEMPKNKKDAMPYFNKAIRNMIMAYKLFTDDQRCETYVLVFLKDLIGILVEDYVIKNEDTIKLKYIDGVDFSTYHCD